MEFSGKTAFVTGAANGIGLGICRALARNGVNLVLADIEQTSLEKARAELSAFNVRTRAIEVDVSDAAAFERAADLAEREFGNIHFLFNNAGITMAPKPLWEITPEQWEWIFSVNVFGVINGIRTLVPRMKDHGEAGHVVNTASIGGLQVNPKLRNGPYAMTKRWRSISKDQSSASPCCARRLSRPRSTHRRNAAPSGSAARSGGRTSSMPRRFTPPGFRPTMSAGACSMRSRKPSSSSSPMRSRANGSRRGTSG